MPAAKTPELRERALVLLKEGMSLRDVAGTLGVGKSTVAEWKLRMGDSPGHEFHGNQWVAGAGGTQELHVEHGMLDERHRVVGGRAVVEPIPADYRYQPYAGKSWLRVYATRDGKHYGASPRSSVHDTIEVAKAAGEKKLADQAASYQRKYKGAEGDDDPGSLTADDSLIASGLVVKAKDSGRILMLQRSFENPEDPAAGDWEFPGGHLEGDDALAAAKREWSEELGVDLPDGEVAGSWISPNGVYEGFVYLISEEASIDLAARDQSKDPDGDYFEAAAWWAPADVPGMPALRPECQTSDWNLIIRASESTAPSGGDGDVVIEPDDIVRAPEMEHMGDRPPPHVHDPDDPEAVLVFDLHGTITKTNGFPLIFAPFPFLKEYMDKMVARGCCIHIATAGLDELDELVNVARLEEIWRFCDFYALPVSHIGPKANAHVFYDDRMIEVDRNDPHWDQYALEAEELMLLKFDLDPNTGKYVRKDREKTGDPIKVFPTIEESPPDRPRGFTSPVLEVDVHRCISFASGSQRTAPLKPGAKEIITQLYNAGYTIQVGCAGWNPATHPREVWEGRYGAQGQYLYEEGIPFDRRVSKDHGDLFHDDKGMRHVDWFGDFPRLLEKLHGPSPEHNIPLAMTEHTTDTKTPETTPKKTDQTADPQKRKRVGTHDEEPRTGRTAAEFERTGPARQEDSPSTPTEPGALQSDSRAMVQERGSQDEKSGTGLPRGESPSIRDVSALGGLPGDREMGQTPVDLGLHDHPVLNRIYIEAMNRYANLVMNGVARHHALAAVKRIDPDFYVQEAQHAWLYTQLANRAKGQKGHPPTDTDKPDAEPGFPTLVKMGEFDQEGLLLAIEAFESTGKRQPELLLLGWSPPQPVPPAHVLSVYDQYEWTTDDTSALQDYLEGLFREQYLETLNDHLTRSGASVVAEITDPSVLDALDARAAEVAAGVGDTFNNDLANQTYMTWIDQRSDLGTQSSRYTLEQEVEDWANERADWKAEQITISESGWADHLAADDFIQNNPDAATTGHVEGPDPAAESECQELLDRGTIDADELMAIDFPVHPNCLVEGMSVVALGALQAASRAFYSGPVLTLETASGAVLTTTPNHPILTGRGWLAAQLLRQGDSLFRVRPLDTTTSGVQLDDVPAKIEDVFQTLRAAGQNASAVSAAADFHGDGQGMKGEIDVVLANRFLASVGKSEPVKRSRQSVLVAATAGRADMGGFASQGPTQEGGLALLAPANRGMGRVGAGRAEHSDSPQAQSYGRAWHPEVLRHLPDGLASQVESDEIVDIRSGVWTGHVYDLQTSASAYIAEGIVVHNCEHYPVYDVDPNWGQNSDTVWAAQAPEEEDLFAAGEGAGHEFHGNQWVAGTGGAWNQDWVQGQHGGASHQTPESTVDVVNPHQTTGEKVFVGGSRTLTDPSAVNAKLATFPKDTQILTSPTHGASAAVRAAAIQHGLPLEVRTARFEKYPTKEAAYFARDEEMIRDADRVVQFYDGSSKGSGHEIGYARSLGKPIDIHILPVKAGEGAGHEFHGNQWTGGRGGVGKLLTSAKEAGAVRADYVITTHGPHPTESNEQVAKNLQARTREDYAPENVNPEVAAAMQKGMDIARSWPAVQAAEAKYGAVPVIAASKNDGDPDMPDGHADGGGNYIALFEHPAGSLGSGPDQLDPQRWAGTYAHEYGHIIQARLSSEDASTIHTAWDNYKDSYQAKWDAIGKGSEGAQIAAREDLLSHALSWYSLTNDHEGFAETFRGHAEPSSARVNTSGLSPEAQAFYDAVGRVSK